jgi:hypothetical protein
MKSLNKIVISASLFLGYAGIASANYFNFDFTLPGNSWAILYQSCPTSDVLMSGGCGHKDANSAGQNIMVNASGPNWADLDAAGQPHGWWCMVTNNAATFRIVRVTAGCTSTPVIAAPAISPNSSARPAEDDAVGGAESHPNTAK